MVDARAAQLFPLPARTSRRTICISHGTCRTRFLRSAASPEPAMITSFRVFDPTLPVFLHPTCPCTYAGHHVVLPSNGESVPLSRGGLPGIFFQPRPDTPPRRLSSSRRRSGKSAAWLRPYHCRTMLDPAIRIGADIMLYPVTPTLEPDWEAMKSLLDNLLRPGLPPC